jgi:uncharacterized membrane protein
VEKYKWALFIIPKGLIFEIIESQQLSMTLTIVQKNGKDRRYTSHGAIR